MRKSVLYLGAVLTALGLSSFAAAIEFTPTQAVGRMVNNPNPEPFELPSILPNPSEYEDSESILASEYPTQPYSVSKPIDNPAQTVSGALTNPGAGALGTNQIGGIMENYWGVNQSKWDSAVRSIQWDGYVNAGFLCNTHGAHRNSYPYHNSHNGGGLNGIYLSAHKTAQTYGCGLDWGFGADIMFGEDARYMRSNQGLDQEWYTGHNCQGKPTYGFAMPQLYADIALNNWYVRMGHFYTLLGYEGAKATDRFFYSTSLSFDALPVTHTGVLASYKGFENLDITLGWVNGINNGFNTEEGDSMVTGKFTYRVRPGVTMSYSFLSGDFNSNSIGLGGSMQGYGCINAADLEVELTERLTSVTTVDYDDYNFYTKHTELTFGQYLFYTVNDCWKWGMRMEWCKTVVGDYAQPEKFSLTVGANWKPFATDTFLIRPEMRYDSAMTYAAGRGLFNDGDSPDQFMLGLDMLYKF